MTLPYGRWSYHVSKSCEAKYRAVQYMSFWVIEAWYINSL